MSTYRAAGCRTVDDVLTVVGMGITGPAAKRLLDAHGERPHALARHGSSRRFATVTDLTEAYETEQADRYEWDAR